MALAIFDLDNTLLRGDSDHAWGEFLADHGYVDGASHRARNDAFYADYCRGELDIFAYAEFVFEVLTRHDADTLKSWHRQFMAEYIQPIILPKGRELIARHREDGDTLMIITATNSFITRPIAHALGIEHLIATDPEMVSGAYTGKVAGIPCYKEGKVKRLEAWLAENGADAKGCWFYSDSRNDLPLLEWADNPVAVDPDDVLRKTAEERGWPVISLR